MWRDKRATLWVKAKAEAAIEKLFAEKKSPHEIKLSDIEQAVHAAGEAIKADLTTGLVEQVSEEDVAVPGPLCSECGQEIHYKGQKPKRIITETGEVTVLRARAIASNLSE